MNAGLPGLPTVPEIVDWFYRVREEHPHWPVARILAELPKLPDLDPDVVTEAARVIYQATDD